MILFVHHSFLHLIHSLYIDNKKNFKQMEIIYYNPNNPEEYSIQVNTKNMIITGGAILALTILPLFFLIVITSIKRKKFN